MVAAVLESSEPIAADVWQHWLPRTRHASWPWICDNIRLPNGQPFDGDNHPWQRGVCEGFDDPAIRELALMWASRLGKTQICLALDACTWATNPMPSMFASTTEKLAKSVVREKLYPLLDKCRAFDGQLKPPSRRSSERIDLRDCHCRVAWFGSHVTLADFGAWLVHGNEVDKEEDTDGSEGDPLDLLFERTKEFPDHKKLVESTPTIKGHSRIERRMLLSDWRRFWVPCPRCHKFQLLKLGNGDPSEAGILWDRLPDGSQDADLAERTARYVCGHCKKEIHDEQRSRMMRQGEWAPDGCWVERGRVKGEPRRRGSIAGFQLSSFYSLDLRWGDIAKQFVASYRRPRLRQNFRNSWEGETYEPTPSTTTPHELGQRLATKVPLGTVPDGAVFLTIAVDKQKSKVGYPWHCWGWGEGETGFLVDRGVAASWDEVKALLRREWANADGTRRLRSRMMFIDSGYKTKEVYAFVKANRSRETPVMACKGIDHLSGDSYRRVTLGKKPGRNARRAARLYAGQPLVLVSSEYWQPVIQTALDDLDPGEPGSFSFPAEAREDFDLCTQLLNEVEVQKVDKKGYVRRSWKKRDADVPNDDRDCVKYARAAAEYFLRRNWQRVPLLARQAASIPKTAASVPREPVPGDNNASRFVRRPSGGRRRGFIRRRSDGAGD